VRGRAECRPVSAEAKDFTETCCNVVFGMIPERVPQKYMPF